jgi:hypothetical protein
MAEISPARKGERKLPFFLEKAEFPLYKRKSL